LGTTQLILLALYVLAGPLAWLGLLGLMFVARSRMTRLRDKRYDLPDPPPRVTVIVPAKDEGGTIRECIQRVLNFDYPNFDVVAIDDRSEDDTGAILDKMARENPQKLRVIHVRRGELPQGWLGKCNALHVGTRDVSGEWLLFVDSDVKVEPPALRDTLGLAVHRQYESVSILTRLETDSLIEELVLPMAAGAWSVMFTISITNNDKRPDIAAANGQFFLIRRDAYQRVNGHAAVYNQICEDVELMRLLKEAGYRVRFQLGDHLASTRMHANLAKMFSGWGRIYCGTARRRPRRIIESMLFVVISGLSVYPALAYGAWMAIAAHSWPWLIAAVAHFGVMTLFLSIIYVGSGNRARMALLFPFTAGVLLALMTYALRLCRTGRMSWRGSAIQAVEHAPTRLASVRKR
jgi:cellulose synthase/poly-beta-1,6-N-acetylglucosamine synthase-like glycosyltransferase